MPRRLPRSARLSLALVKAGLVASMVVAGLSAQPVASPGPGYAGFPVRDASDSLSNGSKSTGSSESRLLERHDCSPTGFADATPLSAVVRSPRGTLRHVSFDEGWEVYSRHGAATLVAVCLDEAPGR